LIDAFDLDQGVSTVKFSSLTREKEPLLFHRPAAQASHASPYTDANDRSRHWHNMERLAEETGRPVLELAPLYEEVLANYNSRARIQDYVPILVSKNVKEMLRRH
jgi:hypothetical protein